MTRTADGAGPGKAEVVDGLRVAVSRDGATAVVRLRGELDLATAGQLEGRLRDLLGRHRVDPVSELVIDTAGLFFVDVSGLRVMVVVQRQLAARGGRLVLRRPSRQVRRLLDLLDLADTLPVED